MIKRIILLLILAAVIVVPAIGANKAYKALTETSLWDKNEGQRRELAVIAKGDSIYTTPEADAYIAERQEKGTQISYLPMEYNGKKGYIDLSDVYPIKISAQDTLTFLQTRKETYRSAQERFLVPELEWAMNQPVSHIGWIYTALISLACAGIFAFLPAKKPFYYINLALTGVALTVTSVAEIMYLLSFHKQILWFMKPDIVGGWGHTILNFIIFSIAIGAQVVLFYYVWRNSLNDGFVAENEDDTNSADFYDDDERHPAWLDKLAYLPLGVGVFLMIAEWVSYFQDGTLGPNLYISAFATLGIAALIGMGYQFSKKRWIQGIIFPVLYVTSSIGIACCVMILGMIVVLVVIVGAIFGVIVMMALSAIGGILFGRERVTGYTSDGRKVTGTKDMYGNVKGDDGNTYTID